MVGIDLDVHYVDALLNRGGGALADPVRSYHASGIAFALGDVNGDGRVDVMTVDGTRVHELLGRGDGTFPGRRSILAGRKPTQLALADLNGDGPLDLDHRQRCDQAGDSA